MLTVVSYTSIIAQVDWKRPTEKPQKPSSLDQLPCFEGCYTGNGPFYSQDCCDEAVKKFMLSHLIYPVEAKRESLEGSVVIQFIVDKNGQVVDPEIVFDPGMGLGEEALRVVQLMPRWTRPGMQNNQYVPVTFDLPVQFKLDEVSSEGGAELSPEQAVQVIGGFFRLFQKIAEQTDRN